MKISIIGRTKSLYDLLKKCIKVNYKVDSIITSDAAPEYSITSKDFEKLATKFKIPFLKTNSFNNDEAKKFIQTYNKETDIGLSVNFPKIIPKNIINNFRLGILNAHGGDLPKYRGNACQAWALINGEDKIGLCIHKMKEELDSGDIIQKDYLKINVNTKIGQVYEWMDSKIPGLMINAIRILEKDPNYIYEKQPDDISKSLRCYPRTPQDGKIIWNQSAEKILRLINASSEPFAGAFCKYLKDEITILDAEIVNDEEPFLAVPGQITKIHSKYIEVACIDKKLRLKNMNVKGSKIEISKFFTSIRKRLT